MCSWQFIPQANQGHHVADVKIESTNHGAAVYATLLLSHIYDFFVLGICYSVVWRCPAIVIEQLHQMLVRGAYQRKSSPGPEHTGVDRVKILEVGVGSGYFTTKTRLPSKTSLTFFDFDANRLEIASTRSRDAHSDVAELAVRTVLGDVSASRAKSTSIYSLLDPQKEGNTRYDVVFINLLLHCLPGPPDKKAQALASLASLAEDTGVLCGATILGNSREVQHSWSGQFFLFLYNLVGWFNNKLDNTEVFIEALKGTFENVSWQVIGTVLLFEARSPKRL